MVSSSSHSFTCAFAFGGNLCTTCDTSHQDSEQLKQLKTIAINAPVTVTGVQQPYGSIIKA